MNVRMAGLACVVAAALAVAVPVAAEASTPTPAPTPGRIVDPRPVPTATDEAKVATAPEPLGAHLPRLAPGQGVTIAAQPTTASAHQVKVMTPAVHLPKVMRP